MVNEEIYGVRSTELLVKAGIKKTELARRLGMHPNTLYGNKELPKYAQAYLELKIEFDLFKSELRKLICPSTGKR